MPKFSVRVPYCVWVNVEIEAEDAEQAEESAVDDFGLSRYCGNGGHNKLVGVTGSNVSVEIGEESLEFEGIEIEVEEI